MVCKLLAGHSELPPHKAPLLSEMSQVPLHGVFQPRAGLIPYLHVPHAALLPCFCLSHFKPLKQTEDLDVSGSCLPASPPLSAAHSHGALCRSLTTFPYRSLFLSSPSAQDSAGLTVGTERDLGESGIALSPG